MAALPVLTAVVWIAIEDRSHRLDHALVQAIERRDSKAAIALLDQGADPNANYGPYRPATFQALLADLLARLSGHKPPGSDLAAKPAILELFGHPGFYLPDTSIVVVTEEQSSEMLWPETRHGRSAAPALSSMLAHGARLQPNATIGNKLLTYACLSNDTEAVRILLEHHADPNAQYISFPLLMTAYSVDCVKQLLEFGADANARSSDGRTRLMFVRQRQLYSMLLAHHADVNAQDNEGKTALIHLFTSAYTPDEDIHFGMRFLLSHGAKISIKDHTGKTALDYALEGRNNWMAGNFGRGPDRRPIPYLKAAMRAESVRAGSKISRHPALSTHRTLRELDH